MKQGKKGTQVEAQAKEEELGDDQKGYRRGALCAGDEGARRARRAWSAKSVARTCAIAAGWVLVWQLASWAVGNPILFAGPLETARALLGLLPDAHFWQIVWSSAAHILVGFALAFVLGLVLAGLSSAHAFVRHALAPLVQAIKATPLVCFVVLLLLWVGSRRVSSYAVFLVGFPAVYFAALQGFDADDGGVREALRVMGVGGIRRALVVTWPKALPYVLAACRNACGMSWKAGVAAELIGTPPNTIGERIYQSRLLLETQDLFAWTIVVILLSYAFERAFLALLCRSGRATQALGARCGWPSAARGRDAQVPRRDARVPHAEPAALELRDVTLDFGEGPVLDHVSHTFAPGSLTCLDDASGRGKTCCLRMLAGVLAPSAGKVRTAGRAGMVFQETRLVDQLSAVNNVRLVAGRQMTGEQVRAQLEQLLPGDVLDRPVGELSGGQRRRVEVVRALCVSAGAVLMDEPFSSLDDVSRSRTIAYVRKHLQGRTLVMSSHQADDARQIGAVPLRIAG